VGGTTPEAMQGRGTGGRKEILDKCESLSGKKTRCMGKVSWKGKGIGVVKLGFSRGPASSSKEALAPLKHREQERELWWSKEDEFVSGLVEGGGTWVRGNGGGGMGTVNSLNWKRGR